MVMEWANQLERTLRDGSGLLMAYVPKLAGALLLLVLGYVLGRIAGAATARVTRLLGLDRLLARTVVATMLDRSGLNRTVSQLLGTIVFWIVFLLFLVSAAEVLSLPILTQALGSLAAYFPRVGLAILIVLLGFIVANFLREFIVLTCNSVGIAQGALISQTVYVASILVVIMTAISELGIDTSLMNNTLVLIVGGLVGGAALSFGLGARSAMSNLIAAHYLRPVLHVGMQVRVGEHLGTVASLTPVAVVMDTPEGRVIVPAARFIEVGPDINPGGHADGN